MEDETEEKKQNTEINNSQTQKQEQQRIKTYIRELARESGHSSH